MDCRTCGRVVEAGSRFCPGCGTPVGERTCPSCGAALPADARFCPGCGTPVQGAAAPTPTAIPGQAGVPARERKMATMLFADLVGSTALSERHDPEVVSRLVGGVFERIAEEVRRYEGTIEKFAGDAMLAVFGVPVAHEDDAERAVRAALEIQSIVGQLGEEFGTGDLTPRLRIGIESGEVLVDLDRASGARDLFVTGDAVNTAARFQSVAQPGTVVVGASTYAATREVVEYEELPPAELKGKAGRVLTWRAVMVKARRGGRRSPLGVEAPLIGRQDELGRLKETVRRAAGAGRPQLVTVIGAAGVGKSRLTWELEKYLDGLPEVYHWRKGRCLAYAQASYAALVDAIKADIGAADDDPPATVIEVLDRRLTDLGGDLGQETRTALLGTLGIDGEVIPRDALVDGWTRFFGRIAAVAPLVLVFEDIHWADDGLLDFIEYLARWGEGPIAILCLARHELLDRRAGWGGGIPNAATIVLEPLGPDDTNRLVEGLLSGGLPEGLRARIVGLAEGNPLFAEELVRMFVDRGVLRLADDSWQLARPLDEVVVPSSIQAVLAARLDGLPGDEKRLAQAAAVIGRIFWDILVAHLSRLGPGATGDLLRRLRVKELVVPRQPSSLAGAAEFGFRHVLIRDVAYDSLPKRDRAALHVDVAGWAETTLADRIDEFAELIAAHLAAALAYEEELAPDAYPSSKRPLRELVYAAVVRAARRAAAVSAIGATQRWQRLAIDLAAQLDLPPRERIGLAIDYYGYLWHETEPAERVAIFSTAVDLFERLTEPTDEDVQARARLQGALAEATFESNRIEDAQAALRAAIAELEPAPPSRGRADLLRILGWVLWRTGSPSAAAPILERSVHEARAIGSDPALRWALHDLGLARTQVGQMDDGLELLHQSFALARDAGDRALLARCYINIPLNMGERGEPPMEIVALSREGLELARRDGAVTTNCWIANSLSNEMEDLGRLDESLAFATEAVEMARRAGDDEILASARETLAWTYLARGDRASALRERELAGVGSRRPEGVVFTACLDAALTWVDDPDAAYRGLVATFERVTPEAQGYQSLCRWVARTALRLEDRDQLVRAVSAFLAVTVDRTGPAAIARRRWLNGLVADPDGREIEAAADAIHAVGYRGATISPLADAALIAARAGRPSSAGERAIALSAEIAMHHLLGPLPETRWLAPRHRR